MEPFQVWQLVAGIICELSQGQGRRQTTEIPKECIKGQDGQQIGGESIKCRTAQGRQWTIEIPGNVANVKTGSTQVKNP